jgi:hypothetical protein
MLHEQIILVSNLWVKQMHFEKSGDVMTGHSHKFDHPTLIAKGSVSVKVNNKITTFTAPHIVYIAKNQLHEITALEPDTIAYCIHPLRGERQEDIYDHSQVPAGTFVNAWNVLNTETLSKKFDEAQDA